MLAAQFRTQDDTLGRGVAPLWPGQETPCRISGLRA